MKKQRRLTSARDFDRVFREGRRASTRAVLCAAANSAGAGRVAVTAAQDVRGAVRRNRAKRLLRETLLRVAPSLRPDVDIVLVAKMGIVGKTFQDVEDDVRHVLERSGAAC